MGAMPCSVCSVCFDLLSCFAAMARTEDVAAADAADLAIDFA